MCGATCHMRQLAIARATLPRLYVASRQGVGKFSARLVFKACKLHALRYAILSILTIKLLSNPLIKGRVQASQAIQGHR